MQALVWGGGGGGGGLVTILKSGSTQYKEYITDTVPTRVHMLVGELSIGTYQGSYASR